MFGLKKNKTESTETKPITNTWDMPGKEVLMDEKEIQNGVSTILRFFTSLNNSAIRQDQQLSEMMQTRTKDFNTRHQMAKSKWLNLQTNV